MNNDMFAGKFSPSFLKEVDEILRSDKSYQDGLVTELVAIYRHVERSFLIEDITRHLEEDDDAVELLGNRGLTASDVESNTALIDEMLNLYDKYSANCSPHFKALEDAVRDGIMGFMPEIEMTVKLTPFEGEHSRGQDDDDDGFIIRTYGYVTLGSCEQYAVEQLKDTLDDQVLILAGKESLTTGQYHATISFEADYGSRTAILDGDTLICTYDKVEHAVSWQSN